MTFQVQFQLFGWSVGAHQLMELLGYAAGFLTYLYFRRHWPRGPAMTAEQTAWVMVGAIFGALLGAKLLAWLESFPQYWEHRHDWHVLIGGKTIVGALLGGWAGVNLAKNRLGIHYPSGDVYVFPVILGLCIGRVGCFLAGLEDHTYGVATTLPLGVDFGDGIARHPAQLYEIAFLLALAGYFAWSIKTGRQRGCMFSQFVLAYTVFRFAVEFIKPRFTLPLVPLSAIQLACLAGIVYAMLCWNSRCCGKAPVHQIPPAFPPLPVIAGFNAKNHHQGPSDRRPLVLELTNSLCPQCLAKVEAKVIEENDSIYLQKFCPEHGAQRVLIADDADYWRRCRSLYAKAPTAPPRRHTESGRGCPWDCGLCPDHDQHSCLAILEITDQCDLQCPICYAGSHHQGRHRSLETIDQMLDAVANSAGTVSVLQISGGEPAQHPELFEILDRVKARSIRHVMLNTNGQRLAKDEHFVRKLAAYMPGFEIYLQFDSLVPSTLRQLRGVDCSDTRLKALELLNRYNISTTLVATLQKGLNDQEIGAILDFAAAQRCVRGVTFQPIQAAGRLRGFNAATDRLTLTEVRTAILRQSKLFNPQDLVPVPCHPDCLTAGYAIRRGDKLVPLSRWVDPGNLVNLLGNTICFEQDGRLSRQVEQALLGSPESTAKKLGLQCCLPLLPTAGSQIKYADLFRVIIMQFMDAHNMDLRSLKRSCVHVIEPSGQLVPFETYNLLFRNGSRRQQPEANEYAYVR